MSKVSKQIEEIIDEKCRFLNKTGTSKGSAIHLAQWMKGQLDAESVGCAQCQHVVQQYLRTSFDLGGEQQQQIDAGADATNGDEVEHIEDWSPDQLHERSKALQLIDENGSVNGTRLRPAAEAPEQRRCESRVEDVASSEVEDETKSASKSTTSDSQVTNKLIAFRHWIRSYR